MKKILSLLIFLGFSAIAGAIGAMAPSSAGYVQLKQPFFAPPGWLFGPVWTLLYILMAIAAWLVWLKRKEAKVTLALALNGVQLVLNAFWTLLFFSWQLRFLAVVEIVVLLITIIITAILFYRVKKLSGWLMAPYIAWVSFATVLCSAVWWLNR
jgi:tryptophan-rich sensory protein